MTVMLSYENDQAKLLIKALTHYSVGLKERPLTARDEAYSIATAYGLFKESPNPSRYASRLLADVKRRYADFDAINLYCIEGTDELATKDIAELANYAAAATVFLKDAAFQLVPLQTIGGSLEALSELRRRLVADLEDQVARRRDDVIVEFVTDSHLQVDSDTPTTYLYRFRTALAQLCDDHLPDEILCQKWLDPNNSKAHRELQDWAASHASLNWAMGITVIEAAMDLAGEPIEGVDHETFEDALEVFGRGQAEGL